MGLLGNIAGAWNRFRDTMARNPTDNSARSHSGRPDRTTLSAYSVSSIVSPIFTRLAVDTSMVDIKHVKVDANDDYVETVYDSLNYCLTEEANLDQTGRDLIRDIVISLCDVGSCAVVPVETDHDPNFDFIYKVVTLRVGQIVKWEGNWVRVRLYNDLTGDYEEVDCSKRSIAIIENPFYNVMNEPSSTVTRLKRKLTLMDKVDEVTGSGKLDILIRLPFAIKGKIRQQQAEERRRAIEEQLQDSAYGVAYIDSTEQVTQLNRASENNLLKQIEDLKAELYAYLGVTQEILNGTANEATMLNYYSRTIEPFLAAITEEFRRKFLSKTARAQGHSVKYIRNPFKLVPLTQIIAAFDVTSRNEILTANESRGLIGYRRSDDPKADELNNSNMPDQTPAPGQNGSGSQEVVTDESQQET